MTTTIKLKLVGLLTTIALMALPVAPALANHGW
jgi:ABC-type Mn2+/Zn2+ transport system permease subunit